MRFLLAIGLASIVALSLFYIMYQGIKLGGKGDYNRDTVRVIDFVRLKQESQTQTKKRVLPKKVQAQKQPTPPSMKMPKNSGGPAQSIVKMESTVPDVGKSVRISGGPHLGAQSDAGSMPLVRIQPMYPRAAAEKRIEGWVEIEFTISAKGSVKNPRVIDARPPNIFNRSALRAIRKWKYKPTIQDGVAIETPGVRVKLKFELDKEGY